MNQLGMIADDLTGSSDSGVQLARKGFDTYVVFHLQNLKAEEMKADGIVIDTDSRALPPEEAYKKVKDAAEKLKHIGFRHIFKKLDSTLRGNLGAEIDGVMDVFPFDFAMVAPAFPRIGRTTKDGIHYLNGIPINQTEIARDPKTPVVESEISKLLALQSKRKTAVLPLSLIRGKQADMIEELKRHKESGIEFLVADAEQEEDLQRIVVLLSQTPYRFLWVGSAGLADYMPSILENQKELTAEFEIPIPAKPVMLVAGSLSKVTKAQVEVFNSQPGVKAIEFDPVSVLIQETWDTEKEKCKQAIAEALFSNLDVSLYVGTSEDQLAKTRSPEVQRKFKHEISLRIADSLGEITAAVLEKHSLQGLILTGGDTAKAVCQHLGVSGIRLIKEVEDGIPLSQFIGENDLLAVTKAGAFGKEYSLAHARQTLKGE